MYFGCVLYGARQLHALHHASEKIGIPIFGHSALRRRLQDHPARTPVLGPIGELGLRLDGGLRDCHRHGYGAGDLLDHPLHQLTPLSRGKLVDLGSEAQHGYTVRTPVQACPHLPPHRFTVERAGTREQCVHHRIDA